MTITEAHALAISYVTAMQDPLTNREFIRSVESDPSQTTPVMQCLAAMVLGFSAGMNDKEPMSLIRRLAVSGVEA